MTSSCIKNTYKPIVEQPSEPSDFANLINNATTIQQLNKIQNDIDKIQDEEIKKSTGYMFPNEVPQDKFQEWHKEWLSIKAKWKTIDNLIFTKRLSKLGPSHQTNPRKDYGPPYDNASNQNPENYSRFHGGKKINSRNAKKKTKKNYKKTKKNKKNYKKTKRNYKIKK
jgi:hypothetical protein